MNKPLLQRKREIEDKMQLLEKDISNYDNEIDYLMFNETFNKIINYRVDINEINLLKKQLQMIDDIIKEINRFIRISYDDSFEEKDHDKTLKLYNKAAIREEFAKRIIGE